MRRILVIATAGLLVLGVFAMAHGSQAGPSDHPNQYGMCRSPVGPAYQGLEGAAVWDPTTQTYVCELVPGPQDPYLPPSGPTPTKDSQTR